MLSINGCSFYKLLILISIVTIINGILNPPSNKTLIRRPGDKLARLQLIIMKGMRESRPLSSIERSPRVQRLLRTLNERTRKRYDQWINKMRMEERRRTTEESKGKVSSSLSPAAQSILAMIFQLEQNPLIPEEEKVSRLKEISKGMDPETRAEVKHHFVTLAADKLKGGVKAKTAN